LKSARKENISWPWIACEWCRPGIIEKESVQNLKKGLEEHYPLLIELTPGNHNLTCLVIEVDSPVKNSSVVSSWNYQDSRRFWI